MIRLRGGATKGEKVTSAWVNVLVDDDLLKQRSIDPNSPNLLGELLGEETVGFKSLIQKLQALKVDKNKEEESEKTAEAETTDDCYGMIGEGLTGLFAKNLAKRKENEERNTAKKKQDDVDTDGVFEENYKTGRQTTDNLTSKSNIRNGNCTKIKAGTKNKTSANLEINLEENENNKKPKSLKESKKNRKLHGNSEENDGLRHGVTKFKTKTKRKEQRVSSIQVTPGIDDSTVYEEQSSTSKITHSNLYTVYAKDRGSMTFTRKYLVAKDSHKKWNILDEENASEPVIIESSWFLKEKKNPDGTSGCVSFESLLQSCCKFTILAGPAGSGKSSILREVEFQFYRFKPVTIENLDDFDTLVRYNCEDSSARDLAGVITLNFPQMLEEVTLSKAVECLKGSPTLYLVDGYDEVHPTSMLALTELIRHINAPDARARSAVIITTRPHAVPTLYSFLGRSGVEMEDCHSEEIACPQA